MNILNINLIRNRFKKIGYACYTRYSENFKVDGELTLYFYRDEYKITDFYFTNSLHFNAKVMQNSDYVIKFSYDFIKILKNRTGQDELFAFLFGIKDALYIQ